MKILFTCEICQSRYYRRDDCELCERGCAARSVGVPDQVMNFSRKDVFRRLRGIGYSHIEVAGILRALGFDFK